MTRNYPDRYKMRIHSSDNAVSPTALVVLPDITPKNLGDRRLGVERGYDNCKQTAVWTGTAWDAHAVRGKRSIDTVVVLS